MPGRRLIRSLRRGKDEEKEGGPGNPGNPGKGKSRMESARNKLETIRAKKGIKERPVPQGNPTNPCPVGKHTDLPDSAFDPFQLAKGIEEEMEHTNDPNIAKQIAKDHLVEIPDYYTRLRAMEEEARHQLSQSGTECELCGVVCGALPDEQFCKAQFKLLSEGKLTQEQVEDVFNEKFGENWEKKVLENLKERG